MISSFHSYRLHQIWFSAELKYKRPRPAYPKQTAPGQFIKGPSAHLRVDTGVSGDMPEL